MYQYILDNPEFAMVDNYKGAQFYSFYTNCSVIDIPGEDYYESWNNVSKFHKN